MRLGKFLTLGHKKERIAKGQKAFHRGGTGCAYSGVPGGEVSVPRRSNMFGWG